jgi:hypothetical protein
MQSTEKDHTLRKQSNGWHRRPCFIAHRPAPPALRYGFTFTTSAFRTDP